jgi:hypothetical protein
MLWVVDTYFNAVNEFGTLIRSFDVLRGELRAAVVLLDGSLELAHSGIGFHGNVRALREFVQIFLRGLDVHVRIGKRVDYGNRLIRIEQVAGM